MTHTHNAKQIPIIAFSFIEIHVFFVVVVSVYFVAIVILVYFWLDFNFTYAHSF